MSLFEEIANKQLELQKMIKEQGQEALKEYFKNFFENTPEITAIRWAQYTPYFNDGDACVFSVYDPEFKVGETTEDEDEDGYSYGEAEGWETSWGMYYREAMKLPEYPRGLSEEQQAEIAGPLYAKMKQVERDFNNNEKVFEMVFGDHVAVLATAEGFKVDEYYHD